MITLIKKIKIQNKLTNYLIINGKKNKSEKIICKILKILQQKLKKSSKKLLQFTLVLNLPLFKIHKISKKKIKKQKTKVIPAFISNKIS
jgi:ribosomal protein S7